MKIKTTQKAINNSFSKRICVGYCALQYLLYFESECAYTTRREGWGADIYDFGNTAIITGYAPFGNIRPDYALCREYDSKAEQIIYSDIDWDEKKEKVSALIEEFIREVTK